MPCLQPSWLHFVRIRSLRFVVTRTALTTSAEGSPPGQFASASPESNTGAYLRLGFKSAMLVVKWSLWDSQGSIWCMNYREIRAQTWVTAASFSAVKTSPILPNLGQKLFHLGEQWQQKLGLSSMPNEKNVEWQTRLRWFRHQRWCQAARIATLAGRCSASSERSRVWLSEKHAFFLENASMILLLSSAPKTLDPLPHQSALN